MLTGKRKKSVQLNDYEIQVEDEPAVTMYGLDNMPIRTSSETYRDIRNQLWPSQVRLRKLSDLRRHSITEQKGPVCTGPIYNIASNKSMAPVPEAPIKELDEHSCEIPWIQEMRRMTVNPAPLSESHLQHLRKCQEERRKKIRHHNRHHEESDDSNLKSRTTSECNSNDDDGDNIASSCSSSASSDDDEEDDDERDKNDNEKSELDASEMKTKLLLERSKKLTKSVSIIKPQQTMTKTYKLRTSKSFPEMKLAESVYNKKVEGVDGKVGRNRKISATGMTAPKRRSSTITIPAVDNTRKTSIVTRNNPNTVTQKGGIAGDGKTTGASTKSIISDPASNKRKTGGAKKTLRRANTDVIAKDKETIPRVRRKSMITIDELVEMHGNQPLLSIKRR